MFPTINVKETGANLHRIMEKRFYQSQLCWRHHVKEDYAHTARKYLQPITFRTEKDLCR